MAQELSVNIDKLNQIMPRRIKWGGRKFSASRGIRLPKFMGKSLNAIGQDIKYRSVVEIVSTCSDTGRMANSHKVSKVKKEGEAFVIYIMNTAPQSLWVHQGTGVYGPKKAPYTSRGSYLMKITLRTPRQVQRAIAGGISDAKIGTVIKVSEIKGQRPKPFLRKAGGIDKSGAVIVSRINKFASLVRANLRYSL